MRLRREVISRDARGFLTWDVIRETMFPPPYATFAGAELHFLQQHGWTVWRDAIRERAAGLPLPCVYYPASSTNAIHHAYHLCRFEEETEVRIRDVETIVEFGGGYGSLCRIAHGAGFTGKYVIFDLPEQSALQRYYLSAVGIPNVLLLSEIEQVRALAETFHRPRLFLATWSLSESPLPLRKRMAEVVRDFDAFLIAYQNEFGGVDNDGSFQEWRSWFPDVRWTVYPIGQVLASSYLFGIREQMR